MAFPGLSKRHAAANGDGRSREQGFHPSPMQKHLIAAAGEFVGTFFFLWFAYAGSMQYTKLATLSPPSGGMADTTVFFIAFVYSFSLLVNVWAFYRISGGLFNPALTLGMCLAGTLPWARAAFLVPAQIIASMCAGGLASAMFPGNIAAANSLLSSDTSIVRGLFIEMFFTAFLVFVVLMLAAERSKDTFIAPIGIGLALFVAMLAGTSYTGASLNPVRSFGCAVATPHFPGYEWIYWLGPFMGAALAAGFYKFVKWSHYEEANPQRDATDYDHDPRSQPAQHSAV
ncbi:aquaporin-like protein [Trichoderma longibrachiatum]